MHRDLAAPSPAVSCVRTLTQRAEDLEWLLEITSSAKGASDDRSMMQELMIAATERLGGSLGVLAIPEKRLRIEHEHRPLHASVLRSVWEDIRQHLLSWAYRHNRLLMLNGTRRLGGKVACTKILAVPVVRGAGRVHGVMAFLNPLDGADFESRHVFFARHLGRQTAYLVDNQFDLMTGLYTRGGMEQMYGGSAEGASPRNRSVVYVDVDHMHVVNELHGFEAGNELIVRIAELLSPPLLPDTALSARISGDRFAVVLPESDSAAAVQIAKRVQAAAARLSIGPEQIAADVSVSCGVAEFASPTQGLARAVAAAEFACKTAKNRGRNRIELYASEDDSVIRRHDDAVAVGELRSALRADRLLLYAQRITPLQNPNLPDGYEILLRIRGEDGALLAPGPYIGAAHRYQLLPTVDRWVIQRAFQTLRPFRRTLRDRRISISINVSGQSLCDEVFADYFKAQFRAANLPADCITVEITEEAATTDIAQANSMIGQLKALGCRFALDDFGIGSNSLASLKNLRISRVKIDGSFVRDVRTDRSSFATVRAIVELANELSMDTVAEYVETDAIADEMCRLGVDYAQGYAFGKPEPLDDVLRSLDDEEVHRSHDRLLET